MRACDAVGASCAFTIQQRKLTGIIPVIKKKKIGLLLFTCCRSRMDEKRLNSRRGAIPWRTPRVHRIYKLTTPPEPSRESGWPRWVPRPPVRARGGIWAPLEGFPGPFSANFGVFGAPGW